MGKKQLLINFLILAFLFIVVYVLTQNAASIRQLFEKPQELVAGVKINEPQGKGNLPKELAQDATEQIDAVKENAMELTLGEVVSFVRKTGRIVEDVRGLQKTVTGFISQ